MLTLEQIFDLSKTQFADLFGRFDYPWEILPYLEEYINEIIKPKNLGEAKGNVYVADNVEIGAGTIIEHGAMIYGPTIIGRNCKIGAGAYIRGNVIIGDDCVIGHATEIKNSFLFNQARAPHFNYVGDSILGYNVNLGTGSLTANYRLDGDKIIVREGEKKILTKLSKFGAIIGDNCSVGCNSVLNPGAVLGKNCQVYPLTRVFGVLAPGSKIK